MRASPDPKAESAPFTGPSGLALSASGLEKGGGLGGQMTPFADTRVLDLRGEELLLQLPAYKSHNGFRFFSGPVWLEPLLEPGCPNVVFVYFLSVSNR